MRYYAQLDTDNRILVIQNAEGNNTVPIDLTDNELNDYVNHVGDYKWENGKMVLHQSYIDAKKVEENKLLFRIWREDKLKRYDVLRLAILAGDLDPATLQAYAPLSDSEKLFRVNVLNFTHTITKDTTENDYPIVPERLR